MDRLLARMERRLGRFAIPNLTLVIAGGMAIVFVLAMSRPAFIDALWLDWDLVKQGQVWRLFTYLFIPSTTSYFWIFMSLYYMWWIGSSLETEWGTFKFNVFYGLGALGTTISAILLGPVGNESLNESLGLAFATLFPEVQIYIFFIIPVRVKWIGWLTAAFLMFRFAVGDWATRGAVAASFGNYLLFFAGHWWHYLRSRNVRVRQAARRAEMSADEPIANDRVCALCGKRQSEGADIRVCSCEKCGGPRNLCLEHARNH